MSKTRTFSHEQTLKYEVAREGLNSRVAALSAQIGREERKSRPDQQLIEPLEDEIIEIGSQRAKLDVTDEEALDRVIATLRKQLG